MRSSPRAKKTNSSCAKSVSAYIKTIPHKHTTPIRISKKRFGRPHTPQLYHVINKEYSQTSTTICLSQPSSLLSQSSSGENDNRIGHRVTQHRDEARRDRTRPTRHYRCTATKEAASSRPRRGLTDPTATEREREQDRGDPDLRPDPGSLELHDPRPDPGSPGLRSSRISGRTSSGGQLRALLVAPGAPTK